MKAHELAARLPIGPVQRMSTHLLLSHLAANVYDAELENGSYLCRVADFKAWLRELADAVAKGTGKAA